MGRLVQSPPAAGADRQHPSGGVGTGVLSATGRVGHGGLTQTNGSPENPGRFKEYQKQHPRAGIPNLLISDLWKDDAWAEKVICGPDDRLSPEQVRSIRTLDKQGLSPEEITKQVGAKNVLQVERVLSGQTYNRIH